MTFTYDPTDRIGQVRRLIGDRVEASQIFSDEEIEAELASALTPLRTAARLLLSIASDKAKCNNLFQIGDIRLDPSKKAEQLREIAGDYIKEDEANRKAVPPSSTNIPMAKGIDEIGDDIDWELY